MNSKLPLKHRKKGGERDAAQTKAMDEAEKNERGPAYGVGIF